MRLYMIIILSQYFNKGKLFISQISDIQVGNFVPNVTSLDLLISMGLLNFRSLVTLDGKLTSQVCSKICWYVQWQCKRFKKAYKFQLQEKNTLSKKSKNIQTNQVLPKLWEPWISLFSCPRLYRYMQSTFSLQILCNRSKKKKIINHFLHLRIQTKGNRKLYLNLDVP